MKLLTVGILAEIGGGVSGTEEARAHLGRGQRLAGEPRFEPGRGPEGQEYHFQPRLVGGHIQGQPQERVQVLVF